MSRLSARQTAAALPDWKDDPDALDERTKGKLAYTIRQARSTATNAARAADTAAKRAARLLAEAEEARERAEQMEADALALAFAVDADVREFRRVAGPHSVALIDKLAHEESERQAERQRRKNLAHAS